MIEEELSRRKSITMHSEVGVKQVNTLTLRGTFKSKAPLRVQFSPALGGRGWERVKAEASPRLY